MLPRRRPPQIDSHPIQPAQGFEHLAGESLAVLKWLQANQVEFVLVGPVAEAIRGGAGGPGPVAEAVPGGAGGPGPVGAAVRGGAGGPGPVAIIPAPYRRNYERLSRALDSAHARPRPDGDATQARESRPAKLRPEAFATGQRWVLGSGSHHLDVEGRPSGPPGYQELLYEAGRFELASGMSVDVASPEDIEHYEHVRRTGSVPEMRITRGTPRQLEPR